VRGSNSAIRHLLPALNRATDANTIQRSEYKKQTDDKIEIFFKKRRSGVHKTIISMLQIQRSECEQQTDDKIDGSLGLGGTQL
jgi:translation initiation factor 1 (eIF-1/SUI1)